MMLAGLAVLAGVTDAELDGLVDELDVPALAGSVRVKARSVRQIAGWGCDVSLPHEHAHRSCADIRAIIRASAMPARARERAERAFAILARAEGAVHGMDSEAVVFHEVGALDSILDICLVCRLFEVLEPARLVCGPLPLADGVIHCAHGHIASPAPAVLGMLEGVPVRPFPGRGETVTPTALALLRALDADFGPWPAMTVRATCISYGTKIFPDAPNGAVWALGDAAPEK